MGEQPASALSVTFNTNLTSDDLDLSLDAEKNREVYGEDKSTFAVGEAAYLKLIRSSDAEYEVFVSAGRISRVASRVPYAMDETVIFNLKKTGSLTHFPRAAVVWQWMGKDAGTPLFTGRSIRLEQASVAVLKCSYETEGDRLKLLVTGRDIDDELEGLEVAVVVVQGENTASATVSFGHSKDPVPVNLLVRDFCSDETVSSVEVFLDGVSRGVTNINGKIYLGKLIPGTTHQLRMTCTGYVDSDLDVLHNDSFTVPDQDVDTG